MKIYRLLPAVLSITACAHVFPANFSKVDVAWSRAKVAGALKYDPERMVDAERLVGEARDYQKHLKYEKAAEVLRRAEAILYDAERTALQMSRNEITLVSPPPTPIPARPMELPEEGRAAYRVKPGDTLWDIAGRKDVYGNHFQWSFIFRANHDQVFNPHVLRPGQTLVIPRSIVPPEDRSSENH